MGDQEVNAGLQGERRRAFLQAILADLQALERMIDEDLFERGQRRVGAELEMFLVDAHWQPAPVALRVLEQLGDPRFTTELAQFNLEANFEPLHFEGNCLRKLEAQMNTMIAAARSAASAIGARVICTGILPTIRKSNLGLENLTPRERYRALNDALTELRGESYEFRIRGTDELIVHHDSVMVESCNASFQCHFQLAPHEFARLYNIAQVLAAPVVAVAANSPMLFGRRLWAETRIAVFEQAVDTRPSRDGMRELKPRVWFGDDYVRESVLELYREDVSRFRALLASDVEQDSMAELDAGRIPGLKALCTHNSTVYRWNRACYGVTDGRPHLRIENRVLPSGPSTVDSIANAAFWLGLMSAMSEQQQDVTATIPFSRARENFHAAARYGLKAHLRWLDGDDVPAHELIERTLLPMAREGLEHRGISGRDIDHYLGVVAERVTTRRTGAQWILDAHEALSQGGARGDALAGVTSAMWQRQLLGRPVAQWEIPQPEESAAWERSFRYVEQFMRTDIFTVQEDDSLEFVAKLMDWNRIRHVIVEDNRRRLIGVISYRPLLRALSVGQSTAGTNLRAAGEIMVANPLSVEPHTPTLDALNLMRQHRLACLPVTDGTRVVGVVTERDFMDIAATLLEERLREAEDDADRDADAANA